MTQRRTPARTVPTKRPTRAKRPAAPKVEVPAEFVISSVVLAQLLQLLGSLPSGYRANNAGPSAASVYAQVERLTPLEKK